MKMSDSAQADRKGSEEAVTEWVIALWSDETVLRHDMEQTTNTPQHEGISDALCQVKEVRFRGYILYNSLYWTFSNRQN